MIQSKTGKPVRFEITETTRRSLEIWIADPEMIGAGFLWPSRLHDLPHMSRRQYARILRGWVMSIGLEPSAYGTHSMRRTKVTQLYKKTGNLRAVQLLLGHTKMDSMVRYLGVEIEDALSLSESIDLRSPADRRVTRRSARTRRWIAYPPRRGTVCHRSSRLQQVCSIEPSFAKLPMPTFHGVRARRRLHGPSTCSLAATDVGRHRPALRLRGGPAGLATDVAKPAQPLDINQSRLPR